MPKPRVRESGKQHVEGFRKYLLRKRMLRWAVDGPVYVPFIGDADLAVDLYTDRKIHGADLDTKRIPVAVGRLPLGADIIVADCNVWPFPEVDEPFAVADFDAYGDPYQSFNAFWDEAQKADRLCLFFTDGNKATVTRRGIWVRFDGSREFDLTGQLNRQRDLYNHWYAKYVYPEFLKRIHPWRVLERMRYLRGHMLYWGAVIEKPKGARRPR